MTNLQIIEKEKTITNITEDVKTYQGWKRAGYRVKKGSKASFQTKIWKPTKISKKKVKDEETEEKDNRYFILVKAYFFTESQVQLEEVKKC